MVFTISLLIDVVISLLCIAGTVDLCIYGGGMGVAIVIIILSLKEFWFPSPEKLGDKIFHKSRNMHPNRLKRKISNTAILYFNIQIGCFGVSAWELEY